MTVYLVSFMNQYNYLVFWRYYSAIPAVAEVNRLKRMGYDANLQVVNHDRV